MILVLSGKYVFTVHGQIIHVSDLSNSVSRYHEHDISEIDQQSQQLVQPLEQLSPQTVAHHRGGQTETVNEKRGGSVRPRGPRHCGSREAHVQ